MPYPVGAEVLATGDSVASLEGRVEDSAVGACVGGDVHLIPSSAPLLQSGSPSHTKSSGIHGVRLSVPHSNSVS